MVFHARRLTPWSRRGKAWEIRKRAAKSKKKTFLRKKWYRKGAERGVGAGEGGRTTKRKGGLF